MSALSPLASPTPSASPSQGASIAAGWLPGGWPAQRPDSLPLSPTTGSTTDQWEVLRSPLPGEQQQRDTAAAVQALLVQGNKGDAFKAREGGRGQGGLEAGGRSLEAALGGVKIECSSSHAMQCHARDRSLCTIETSFPRSLVVPLCHSATMHPSSSSLMGCTAQA